MKIPFLKQKKEKKLDQIKKIPIQKIKINPFQPRQEFDQGEITELAESIKNFGLIQAVTVRKQKDEEKYELVAGERRLRAARHLNKEKIPAVIKEFNDQEMAEIALVENLQRKDLNFLEEAQAYKRLLAEFDLTQKELSEKISKSQSTVANKLRLLKLPSAVRKNLIELKLSERHGRALLKIKSEQEQLELLKKIAEKNLNVRESEKLIKQKQKTKQKSSKKRIKHLADDLRLFANSIEKRISEVEESGINVEFERSDQEDTIEYYIKLSK